MREEERKAWQKLLRVLSHEINNSIAPIASIGETLEKMVEKQYSGSDLDNDLKEGLGVITERAQSLNVFIQRYQQLTRLPSPHKTMFNVALLIQSVSLLVAETNFDIHSKNVNVYADENQLQQVLVNLIKNAVEAMQGDTKGQITIDYHKRR